jgi:hypothetical protein
MLHLCSCWFSAVVSTIIVTVSKLFLHISPTSISPHRWGRIQGWLLLESLSFGS